MVLHAQLIGVLCWLLVGICLAEFDSDSDVQLKVLQAITGFEQQKIPIDKRALSIYYLANPTSEEDSHDVIVNNLKLYMAVVQAHNFSTSVRRAFYIFNVAGGNENVLYKHIQFNTPNAAFIKTSVQHNDLLAHVQMTSLLGETIISKFQSVFFINQDARGPFVGRKNGEWWKYITSTFDAHPQVALLGPVISCEIAPHVQTHAFAMRSDAVLEILAEFNPRSASGKRNRAKHLETALSTEALSAGHKISSIYYQRQFSQPIFNGTCVSREGNTAQYKSNPTSWCDIKPSDAIFMKWGGPPLRIRGYYCKDTIDSIQRATLQISTMERGLSLLLPETIYGGKMHLLHKEYDVQQWMDRSSRKIAIKPAGKAPQGSKVCLIVRTSLQQGKKARRNSRLVQMDINMLIQSLLRQSNPNWEAYFIVTDDQPFDDELQAILRDYGDYRLAYLAIEKKYRPAYTVRDAGYTATDQALRTVQKFAQCKWLSITNGDNIYGSDVFANVLATGPTKETGKLPDVMLSPLDSRNYADQDYTRKRIAMDRPDAWDLRCVFLENELKNTRYGYAMTPWPTLGGLDLAGLFMDRKKFIDTGVYFGQFSDPKKYVCPGCQDGYFISEVMTVHKWSLHRMPIHKFSSLIFHGASPLWCIAGGNVWFDHPGKTVCLSHKTVGHLYPDKRFDWETFYQAHGPRICLRMSQEGYANMSSVIIS